MIDDYHTHEELMEESQFYFNEATDEERATILARRHDIALEMFENYGKDYKQKMSPSMAAGFSFTIGKTMDILMADPHFQNIIRVHAEFGDMMKLAYVAGWRDHADQQNINHIEITGGTNETD